MLCCAARWSGVQVAGFVLGYRLLHDKHLFVRGEGSTRAPVATVVQFPQSHPQPGAQRQPYSHAAGGHAAPPLAAGSYPAAVAVPVAAVYPPATGPGYNATAAYGGGAHATAPTYGANPGVHAGAYAGGGYANGAAPMSYPPIQYPQKPGQSG